MSIKMEAELNQQEEMRQLENKYKKGEEAYDPSKHDKADD